MDTVATSRRHPNIQKGNKENAQPAGSKSSLKRNVSKLGSTSTAPLKQKSNEKEETQAKKIGFQKVKPKKENVLSSGDALKKSKTVQKDNGAVNDTRNSLSLAFRTEQAVKYRKLAEATKPPIVPSARSALGMYKGKVVQSKIGSIWKSSGATMETTEKSNVKPSAPKVSQNVGNLTKTRSKSIADLPGKGVVKLQPSRPKSVSDGPPPVSKRLVTSRPPARSAPPPPSSRITVVPKGKGTRGNTAMAPVDGDKVKKHVGSTLSQYRVCTETAEERRAKLSEWLASKGKSLKRPAMTAAAAAPKTKAATKAVVQTRCQVESQVDPELAVQREPEPSRDHHGTGSIAAPHEELERPEKMTHNSTPQIMNTTLDLLDNSDMDLPVDPEPKINDIVVNLCDALAALETPSACEDAAQPINDESRGVVMEANNKSQGDMKSDLCEDVVEEDEAEEDEAEEEEEFDESDEDDDEKDLMGGASVVKYSVKTTPYLQSVKKTIEGEASACGSRRKSSIKDLKFLTPVRRSCRIQRKSSRLPGMLMDHDPCVSSLAELVKMDDDPNAYIYRKNPALLEDLPDQPKYF